MSKKETTNETVDRTSEKETTKESVIQKVVDRRSTHEQSYGGKLPGFIQTKPTDPNQDQEVTTPQDTGSDPQDTDSESQNQDSNQGEKTEKNQ